MYLTAHHVRSPRGEEGINVFRHLHGSDYAWPSEAAPLADIDAGQLDRQASIVTVPPGGNQVRAYLDVLTPDDTAPELIHAALTALASDLDERRNPTVFVLGPVTVRFGVELGFESVRRAKLQELVASLARAVPR